EPDVVWRANGNVAEISRTRGAPKKSFKRESKPTLRSLRALLAESKIALPDELPPMAAGVFGYMGYDTVRLIERLPDVRPDALEVPDSVLIRPTIMMIFDAVKDEITVVTPVRPEDGTSAE